MRLMKEHHELFVAIYYPKKEKSKTFVSILTRINYERLVLTQ